MTTISAERIRERETNSSDDTVAHGAHVPCQLDQPKVTAICGTQLAWDDEQPATIEMCVVCRDLRTCPVCGMELVLPA